MYRSFRIRRPGLDQPHLPEVRPLRPLRHMQIPSTEHTRSGKFGSGPELAIRRAT